MSPYILFSILIGSIYGAAFHIWQGKTMVDAAYYVFSGIIGFGLGQIGANFFGWTLFMIGPIHIIEASLVACSLLLLARWLRL